MAGLLDFAMPQPSGGGGLLDFAFSDPGARLGLSLLAASSPKLRPLGQAMAQQDASKQQALQQQYIQSQIAENTSQAKMREQQLSMAQQKQNVMNGLFGVGGGSPLAGVTTGGGVNVPAASGAGIAGGGGGVENLTLSQVAWLKANGIDVADLWKFGKEGIKREAGNYYENLNGDTKYLPKLDNGMAVSGGQVVAAPGYAQANSLIKGSETSAVEGAKYPFAIGLENAKANIGSANDLVILNLPSGPVQVTRAQALAMTQPQAQQPQGPQVGGGQNLTPQLRDLIAQDAAANGIQNPTTNFQGAGRGQAYGVTNAPARGVGIPLQSKAADEFGNTVAKSDAEQLTAWRSAAENANSALSTVENLRDAVSKGVYSGGGAQAKTAAASIINGLTGIKPKGFVGSELFNANASALVLDRIKTLGPNPSNADREFIERTIPNLDKSAEARDALINFMEQKARGSIDLYKRADTHARQNNGLAGFDQFAKPKPAQGTVIDFGSLK